VIDQTNIILNQKTSLNLLNSSMDSLQTKEAINILIAEGGECFYNYVDKRGLTKDQNMVVLSSRHHYFYDVEELNNFNTVINLKELNQIKRIKSHFHSCLPFLPQKSNFVGCFIDNKKINGYSLRNRSSIYADERSFDDIEYGIVSRIPFIKMLFDIMDSKTNTYLSQRSVSLLLKEYGFNVMDMTEINGLTYFHSQKNQGDFN
jgi:hypothetical protein